MRDLTARIAPPLPSLAEKLKFYGMWLGVARAADRAAQAVLSGGSLTTFSLIGISIIFALSYNILLGQTGMLSFGHAVYYGLGGFLAIHAINLIGGAKYPIPLPLVPLIGGATGLFFAALIGWVMTQRSGTAFAMISLGLAELVASSALILRSFFGGEAGISANRTKMFRVFDFSFGPQIQIYYLVAAWTLIAIITMYALTRTPLGRMCNAVRTIPAAGNSSATIRMWCAIWRSALPACSPASQVRSPRSISKSPIPPISARCSPAPCCSPPISAASAFSIGPIVGAIFVTILSLGLSDVTSVSWQLYFGLFFIGVVMFTPGGLTGLIMMHRPLWRAGMLTRMLPSSSARRRPDARLHHPADAGDRDHRALHGQSERRSAYPRLRHWGIVAPIIRFGLLMIALSVFFFTKININAYEGRVIAFSGFILNLAVLISVIKSPINLRPAKD